AIECWPGGQRKRVGCACERSAPRHKLDLLNIFITEEGVMNFSMTEDEAEVAKEILAQNHRELLLEISRAEHHEFKLALQQREEVLKRLLEKLGVPEFTHSRS